MSDKTDKNIPKWVLIVLKMDKKQTAVEWLSKRTFIPLNELEQAKQMEKEQIMMAVKDSWYMAKGSNFQEPQAQQYYNETYGK